MPPQPHKTAQPKAQPKAATHSAGDAPTIPPVTPSAPMTGGQGIMDRQKAQKTAPSEADKVIRSMGKKRVG